MYNGAIRQNTGTTPVWGRIRSLTIVALWPGEVLVSLVRSVTLAKHKKKFQLLDVAEAVVPWVYDNKFESLRLVNKLSLSPDFECVDRCTGWSENNNRNEQRLETERNRDILACLIEKPYLSRYCWNQSNFKVTDNSFWLKDSTGWFRNVLQFLKKQLVSWFLFGLVKHQTHMGSLKIEYEVQINVRTVMFVVPVSYFRAWIVNTWWKNGGVARKVPSIISVGLSNNNWSCFGLPNSNILFLRDTDVSQKRNCSPVDVVWYDSGTSNMEESGRTGVNFRRAWFRPASRIRRITVNFRGLVKENMTLRISRINGTLGSTSGGNWALAISSSYIFGIGVVSLMARCFSVARNSCTSWSPGSRRWLCSPLVSKKILFRSVWIWALQFFVLHNQ